MSYKEYETPGCRCPYCGYDMESAYGEMKPRPGNICICIHCVEPCVFDEELMLDKVDTTKLPMDAVREIDKIQIHIIMSRLGHRCCTHG